MRIFFTLLATTCMVGFSSLCAQVLVKEKTFFTGVQRSQIEYLVKEYTEHDKMNEISARIKAEKEVASGLVGLRAMPGGSGLRPDLATWPTNHAAWLNTNKYPGSIEVDRDATIHGYLPSELVKKVLLKTYSVADEARIQNVRFKGWNGVSGGGDAWMDNNTSLSYKGNGNRGLAYFNKGTSDFDIEKGLLLSTSDTWGHEGPNELTAAFGDGVGFNGVSTSTSTPFDIDILQQVIISSATYGGLLEFDFCPAVGKASFDYVFGSDEYPEYSNTQYNDGFGFFVSGPYETAAEAATEGQNQISGYTSTTTVSGVSLPSGRGGRGSAIFDGKPSYTYYQYNIAQLPNGDPVSVNWTNWGWRSAYSQGDGNSCTSATGWSVNPWDSVGVRGGGSPLITNPTRNIYTSGYSGSSKAMNPEYHRAVCDSSAMMELDGITTKLTAVADSLIPGKWYHMKMVVCQKDVAHGDGVFLGNLDLGYAGGNIGGPSTGVSVADIDAMGMDSSGDPMFLYGNRPCTYPMRLTFDATAASGNQIVDIEYITDPGCVFPKSALQNLEGKQLFTVDTIQLNGLQDTVLAYDFKMSTDFDGFVNGQSVGIYVKVRGGGGDTVFYRQLYDTLSWKYQYRMVTEVNEGYLSLKVDGGTPYVYRSIDDGETWQPITKVFTQWELLCISESCDILLYQPFQCCYDTVKVRRSIGEPPVIQRYVDIPVMEGVVTYPAAGSHYVESRKDFSFTAFYTGEPMKVQATGHYSKTTLDLDKTSEQQQDGSYKYTIRYVVEPWTVSFVPSPNSGGVSNESLDRPSVWSNGNTLHLNLQNTCVANIYTLTGLLYKQVEVSGNASLQLPEGFYIVSVDGRQYKIMIK